MKVNLFVVIMFLGLTSFSCVNKNNKNEIDQIVESLDDIKQKLDEMIPRMKDTVINIRYDEEFVVTTEIIYPDKDVKGAILLLHGWNLPKDEWCEKTSFCNKALEKGYVLIIPDYSKSNYTLEVYPETILEYRKYPTLTWIIDNHITYFQKNFMFLKEGQNNFVAGISTGGRGATLLAYYLPEIFKGTATLSGDFDITKMTDEYLYYSFLGKYEQFTERWKSECFAYDCENYIIPTYIGHGKSDKVSPYEQSLMLYDSIKYNHPEIKLIGNFPDSAKHDYNYWESETDNILNFFDSLLE